MLLEQTTALLAIRKKCGNVTLTVTELHAYNELHVLRDTDVSLSDSGAVGGDRH